MNLVYSALLTQTGTNAPEAVVLQNTLGATITWTRSSEGTYLGMASSAVFTNLKTVLLSNGNVIESNGDEIRHLCFTYGSNTIVTMKIRTSADVAIDCIDIPENSISIQIIVFP